jgi:ABC-2 type transport system ATP-binding protein
MEYILKVNNLTKSYGERKAVNGISFAVKKGEILGFLGLQSADLVPQRFYH